MAKKSRSNADLLADLRSFQSKDYRDGFLETDVKGGIALQIQALREKLGMTQTEFAKKIGKPQPVISRLENEEDRSVTINTLLEIAMALDIALQVRFCDYVDVLQRDTSPAGMKVNTIFETLQNIQTRTVVPSGILEDVNLSSIRIRG
jgi:transcriptional regulator with XRE-family HTH domain